MIYNHNNKTERSFCLHLENAIFENKLIKTPYYIKQQKLENCASYDWLVTHAIKHLYPC